MVRRSMLRPTWPKLSKSARSFPGEDVMHMKLFGMSLLGLGLSAAGVPAWAQNVKITPLGTHPGELCDRDRATIFEDPTGVRILYDAGQSVMGGEDPRLGTIHVVLLSHAQTAHIGHRQLSPHN